MKYLHGSGFGLPATSDIVHCWAHDVRGPASEPAFWHTRCADMKSTSGVSSLPLIVA
jgi:hypothetical protein